MTAGVETLRWCVQGYRLEPSTGPGQGSYQQTLRVSRVNAHRRRGHTATLTLVAAHEAELDAIVDMLTEAGLIEQYTDDDGKPALRLTDQGAQVGRALAMAGGDADPDVVLGALLAAQE